MKVTKGYRFSKQFNLNNQDKLNLIKLKTIYNRLQTEIKIIIKNRNE
jgi:hypothetical protein